MTNYIRFIFVLFVGIINGCQSNDLNSLQTSQRKKAPILNKEYSEQLDVNFHQATYSSDGRLLMLSGFGNSVFIYNAALNDRIEEITTKSHPELAGLTILSAQFSDNNHVSLVTQDEENVKKIYIYQLEPFKRSYIHWLNSDYGNAPVQIINDYIAYGSELFNWRNNELFTVDLANPTINQYRLTNSGKVMTDNDENGSILLSDAINNHKLSWNTELIIRDIAIDNKESYAVALGNDGTCFVWKLPETDKLGDCNKNIRSYDIKHEQIKINPDKYIFAVSRESALSIYSLQSLTQPFDISMTNDILLSDIQGNLAAIVDIDGNVEVWRISDQSIVGKYAAGKSVPLLALHPNERYLTIVDEDFMLSVFIL